MEFRDLEKAQTWKTTLNPMTEQARLKSPTPVNRIRPTDLQPLRRRPAAERERAELEADQEDVAAHYEEMTELGAHIKGEGEIK
jgi:hypothetical protein